MTNESYTPWIFPAPYASCPLMPRARAKNPFLRHLGHEIQKARFALNLSQEQLAAHAGLHRTYVGMVERGERNITVINLMRIATALDIEPGALLPGMRVKPKDVF